MDVKCCICLGSDNYLKFINETDPDNQSYGSKLESCVPEIDWKNTYQICGSCIENLDIVHSFRQKCINADRFRQQNATFENEVPDVPEPGESPVNFPALDLDNEDGSDSDAVADKKTCRRTVQKTQVFLCERCDRTFNTSKKLVKHATETHRVDVKDVKPFACDVCKNKFATSSNLVQHLKYHEGSRTYTCTFCGKGFITKTDLLNHEKLHLNKREYKCDGCSKSFNTHKDLRSHKVVVHSDPSTWNFICDICNKRFPIKSNYDGHMRRHNDERRFSCHICDKKFIDKCVLKKHYRIHSNVRDYECNVCRKGYKDKRVMEIHRAKVHGIGDVKVPVMVKKHFCHVCPKSYFAKNKLTRHMCTHTGERPFFCRLCERKFTDKYYVKQHMKKAHNVIEDNPAHSE